jgi:predicted peptidase
MRRRTTDPRRHGAIIVSLALTLTGLTASPAVAVPDAAAPSAPVALDATVIAEVRPVAYTVTAVAVRYDRPVHVPEGVGDPSSFEVTATLGGQAGPRTVTRVYSNDGPERDRRAERGRYLIVELAETDPNAGGTAWDPVRSLTVVHPLAGAYTVEQTADLVDRRGRVVLPASGGPVTSTDARTPVADEFRRESFTASNGTTLDYRLFEPARSRAGRERYPLVLALHGFGERGTDNTVQIVANQLAHAFAEPRRQATDPSFVLAPQAPAELPPGEPIWNPDAVQEWLLEVVEDAVARYPVDPDRVYLTGLSMGSMGSFALLPEAPDVFAGALLATGLGDPADAPVLARIPLWAVHSVDDGTVPYDAPDSDRAVVDAIAATGRPVVYGEWPADLAVREAEAEARALWRAARSAGGHTLFTTYPAGTTPGGSHFAWVPMYQNGVQLDWLFSQRRR